MLYEQKVKYMEYRESGTKVRGVGFVKLERWGESCNMLLQISGLPSGCTGEKGVYLCGGRQEILLGLISLEQGRGRLELQEDDSRNSTGDGITLAEAERIRIPIGPEKEVVGILQEKPVSRREETRREGARENLREEIRREEVRENFREETRMEGARENPHEETRVEGARENLREEIRQEGVRENFREETRVEGARENLREETRREGAQDNLREETRVEEARENPREEIRSKSAAGETQNRAYGAAEEKKFAEGNTAIEEPRGEIKEGEAQNSKRDRATPGESFRAVSEEGLRGQNPETQGREVRRPEVQGMEVRRPEAQGIEAQRPEPQVREAQIEEPRDEGRREVQREDGNRKKMEAPLKVSPEDGGELREKTQPYVFQASLQPDKWEQLRSIYPPVRPFGDDREYLRISPGDFVILKDKSYRLANNSFLLHGYFNYKHLILHRTARQGENVYFIGVPGNFYDKEKEVAILFGFESFECAREPAKEGDYGYYMMRVEL